MKSSSPLRIKAGKEALALIKKEGFSADMIRAVASAAGGPKWFTAFGLTRYVLADLLSPEQHCHLIGASVGSWQMTAGACPDPGVAMDSLKAGYAGYRYSDEPDAAEISRACREFTGEMIRGHESHIISNPHRQLHIITSHGGKGLNSDNKWRLGATLGAGFLGNILHRKFNYPFAHRVIWSNTDTLPYDTATDVLPTTQCPITKANLQDAMQASGAIPFMMERVRDIAGGPKGSYWDGGLTDYQISLPYQFDEPGIVMHPHFSEHVLAGWFDKKLPWTRKATPSNMSKVLLLYPSADYIQSLPRQQISDMKDFYHFGTDQEARIKYWYEIADRSQELADQLHDLISTQKIVDYIEPY